MNPIEQTNLQDRRRPDAPAPGAAAANTPPPGNGHTPRHRESEGGLNLKPSGRTHGHSSTSLDDRSTHTGGQTVGQIAVENPLFSCRDVSVYYGQKHALKKVSIDVGRKQVLAMIGP